MTTHEVWTPSYKWHLGCVGICLTVCLIVFGALSLLRKHLPVPYQPRVAVADTLTWNE